MARLPWLKRRTEAGAGECNRAAESEQDVSAGLAGTEVSALKGVSLAVEQGEAFGFVGQNGAGKSTTIKI